MALKGVCLDGGPVPYVILPYMANGSLLSYIRKERNSLVLIEEADTDNGEMLSQVSDVNIYGSDLLCVIQCTLAIIDTYTCRYNSSRNVSWTCVCRWLKGWSI